MVLNITMSNFIFGFILFFAGLESSKYSLNKLGREKIKAILHRFTGNIFICIFFGAVFTAFIQSSSAMSIIIIGLLDTSLIKFDKALALLIGANVGTTITAQIFSIPIIDYYPFMILLGIIMMILSFKLARLRYFGVIILSFASIFAGLHHISLALSRPFIYNLIYILLDRIDTNIFLIASIGAVITALMQSSSLFTGIIIKLAETNIILFDTAISFIIGSNLGTCITAFLASITSSSKAKYLALGHFLFNLSGAILILPFLNYFIVLIKYTSDIIPRQIANAHTLFNIFTIVIFIPIFKIIFKQFTSL